MLSKVGSTQREVSDWLLFCLAPSEPCLLVYQHTALQYPPIRNSSTYRFACVYGIMALGTDHQSLPPTCGHNLHPEWWFLPTFYFEVFEGANMVNFDVTSGSTKLAYISEKPFSQFIPESRLSLCWLVFYGTLRVAF